MRFEINDKKRSGAIVMMVCNEYEVEYDDVVGCSRMKVYVRIRALICRLLRDGGEMIEAIGEVVGRDHSSVVYMLKSHDRYMEDRIYRKVYEKVRDMGIRVSVEVRIRYYESKIEELKKLL